MKYQTNPELGEFLNHWGCHVVSIIGLAEKLSQYFISLSNEQVYQVYHDGMWQGAIQKEEWNEGIPFDGCDVLDGKAFFNIVTSTFEIPVICTEYRKESKDYVCQNDEMEILELGRDGYNGSHFVIGNGRLSDPWQDEIEFDPIEGGSNCARLGYIKSKRILKYHDI